jgi:hypothetical protein
MCCSWTDGEQSASCGGPAGRDPITIQTIEMLSAHGYPTYVVGFGGEVSPTSLDAFAAAGGVPRAGTPRYYQADTAAELQAVLQGIAGSIAGDEFSCSCRGTPCPDDAALVPARSAMAASVRSPEGASAEVGVLPDWRVRRSIRR